MPARILNLDPKPKTLMVKGMLSDLGELQKQILRRNMRFFHAASMTDLWLMYLGSFLRNSI